MERSLQYDWKRIKYRHRNRVSPNFDDVVPKSVQVVLRKDMFLSHWTGRNPFLGVQLIPYTPVPEITQIRPLKNDLKTIWREFKNAIKDSWNPEKIHLIGTSSGYDSRMVAKAIKELRQEEQDGWFGETYFVECGGESGGFKQIMNILGYTPQEYKVWTPNYTYDFFEDHHKRYNGLCAYPVNQWYDFYIKNWSEGDFQYISGYGGNVADAMRISPKSPMYGKLNLYFKNQYYYQLSAFRQPKESIHPFWSWRYIRAVCGLQHPERRTSHYLSKVFVPECESVPRDTILGDVRNRGYLHLNPNILTKLYHWYRSTRYGKKRPINPTRRIEYNQWWLQFCIAKYAEANNIDIY